MSTGYKYEEVVDGASVMIFHHSPLSPSSLATLSLMPQSTPRSDPHRRTRRDHAMETAEDYVEAIAEIVDEHGSCRVVDLARRFAVSHVTVTRIISRLQNEGLVQTERYRPISLTAKGKKLAAKSRRRHEIVYRFLLSIGVSERNANIDAEGIEHHVSPETLQQFERFISSQEGSSQKGGAEKSQEFKSTSK